MTTPSPSPTPPPPPPPPPPPQPPSALPPLPPPPPTAPSVSSKCFNSVCTENKLRKAWRLRSGELAELCDRCATVYEEGKFCETFHLDATGWRCCDSCAKRVHCGCIVSVSAFTMLDAGGIECMTCARKNAVYTSNSTWSPLYSHGYLSDRVKDISAKNRNQLGPVPWRQAPSLFNSIPQADAHPKGPCEVSAERSFSASLEKGKIENLAERFVNGNLKLSSGDKIENRYPGTSSAEQQSSCMREDLSASEFRFGRSYTSINETNGKLGSSTVPMRVTLSPLVKQPPVTQNGGDLPVEPRPRGRPRGRSQLHSRYLPRFTDEALALISGNSNSTITPLFEKMLSASDAGRIGRLVLPKKCAEAYFPPISQPEGLPLKVHDSKGKEWIFQFRFWPNNNSRMYVLEGVTPCIQSMQLQAGDIVMFSRLEPEGKLVMGFRKASAPPSDQDNELSRPITGASGNGEVNASDPTPWSKVDKSGYIAKEALDAKPLARKRKNSVLGSKSKRLRLESEDMIQLKLTWEEAQGLLRPPPEHRSPNVVVIDGFEIEEFEDPPVLGKPTILANDKAGNKVQWMQCEDCSKWRKVPVDALLPYRWTCSRNLWDLERASCLADQELNGEQLRELLPSQHLAPAPPKKPKPPAAKPEKDGQEEAVQIDMIASSAIFEEGGGEDGASSAMTTKHPRHKPGCTCIVCIQPPSGKGPKHKPTCACTVCEAVKRRFTTQQMKRMEKREAEAKQMQLPPPLPDDNDEDDVPLNSATSSGERRGSDEGNLPPSSSSLSSSSFKGGIDLNIQPEREEEAATLPVIETSKKVSSPTTGNADTQATTMSPNDVSKLVHDSESQEKVSSSTSGIPTSDQTRVAAIDQTPVATSDLTPVTANDQTRGTTSEQTPVAPIVQTPVVPIVQTPVATTDLTAGESGENRLLAKPTEESASASASASAPANE